MASARSRDVTVSIARRFAARMRTRVHTYRRHFESCTRCSVVGEKEDESPRISSCGRLKGKYFSLRAPAVESLSLVHDLLLCLDTQAMETVFWKRERRGWKRLSSARRQDLHVTARQQHLHVTARQQDFHTTAARQQDLHITAARQQDFHSIVRQQDLHATARQHKTFTQSSASKTFTQLPPASKTFTQLPPASKTFT